MTGEQYIIIIGAMKSGTTTVFKMLADHSKIAPAQPKEPGFFAFEENYAKGFEWFHSLFDFDPNQHIYRMDGSTDYTKSPFVTGVLKRMFARPGARYKFIYIMRHPLRRFESHARHVQRTKKEIGQVLSQRADHGLDSGVSLPSLAISRYADQLDNYAVPWAAGDLFLTTLEELNANFARVRSDLLAFLNLEDENVDLPAKIENRASYTNKEETSILKLVQSPIMASIGKAILRKDLRTKIKNQLLRDAPVEGRFALLPAEENVLMGMLAPDLQRLQEVYGVDVKRLWFSQGE